MRSEHPSVQAAGIKNCYDPVMKVTGIFTENFKINKLDKSGRDARARGSTMSSIYDVY